MATKPKPCNGLMFHAQRTEQLLAQLRKTIAPFRQLSPKIVTALGPTGERTPEQWAAADACLKEAYSMLVDVQWFLSEYDDPDTLADDMDDGDDEEAQDDEEEVASE